MLQYHVSQVMPFAQHVPSYSHLCTGICKTLATLYWNSELRAFLIWKVPRQLYRAQYLPNMEGSDL